MSGGFGITLPVFVASAGTSTLEDVDGNTFIDLASGIAVTSVGAANPVVREHVAAQLDLFTHTCFMVTEYEGFVRVAEWLNAHTPGDFEKRTALFSTGAEAVENAVKIARAHTGRPGVLVIDEGYHGRSLLTLAMTAKEHPYNVLRPVPDEVVRGPANPLRPVPRRGRGRSSASRALASVEATPRRTHGADHFAALVIEPIQGEGGFVVPAPGFLVGLRELADRYGIVLVIDEIQAGMGRTGRLFASEHEGVAGDLTLTAKALAGGLPLSAVTGRAELMNAAHAGGLGGTYAGNPLACEAALAVFGASRTGPCCRGRASRRSHANSSSRCSPRSPPWPRSAAAAPCWPSSSPTVDPRPARGPGQGDLRPATRGRAHPDLRHPRQRHPTAAAAGDRRGATRDGLRCCAVHPRRRRRENGQRISRSPPELLRGHIAMTPHHP